MPRDQLGVEREIAIKHGNFILPFEIPLNIYANDSEGRLNLGFFSSNEYIRKSGTDYVKLIGSKTSDDIRL